MPVETNYIGSQIVMLKFDTKRICKCLENFTSVLMFHSGIP